MLCYYYRLVFCQLHLNHWLLSAIAPVLEGSVDTIPLGWWISVMPLIWFKKKNYRSEWFMIVPFMLWIDFSIMSYTIAILMLHFLYIVCYIHLPEAPLKKTVVSKHVRCLCVTVQTSFELTMCANYYTLAALDLLSVYNKAILLMWTVIMYYLVALIVPLC